MKPIYTSTWILEESQNKHLCRVTAENVIVSGLTVDEISQNEDYKMRALRSLNKKQSDLSKYRVVKVVLGKQIGNTNK